MLGKVTAYAYSQSTLINWKLKYIYFQQSSSSDLQHIGRIYLEAGPGFQTQKKIKLIIPLLFSDTSFVIFFFYKYVYKSPYHWTGNLEVLGDSFTAYLSFS